MKVLFLTRRFYPDIGGVEKHILEVSKKLIGKGHEVTVISSKEPQSKALLQVNYHSPVQSDTNYIISKSAVKSSQIEFFEVEKIKVYRINFGKSNFFLKFKIWLDLLSFSKIFFEADVIHAHDVFYWCYIYRFLFFWKKFYVTFHGYESFPLPFKNKLMHKLSEVLADGNICVGDFMKKWYWTRPDYVIYGAVDSKTKSQKSKVKNKASALFFGRLDEQTGILEYKTAVELIKKHYPAFKLDVIGDGKYRKKLENYVISGFIKNPVEKLENYEFAFVSRYLSILEAMVRKKLVFALYDNPIKEDYLKMSPFASKIVISSSADDLASKLEYYLKNPSAEKKMVVSAYNWASKQTWEKLCKTYLHLWKL